MPINFIDGVQIELSNKKKSCQKDFKNSLQYISSVKDPNVRTQFDNLPKIKTSEIDEMIRDQNPTKKTKKRVWDKTKKDFVWQKDA